MKNKIDQIINEELDDIAQVSPNDVKGKFDLIQELSKEIQSTECHLQDLQTQLRHAVEEFNAALGTSLRKRIPKINVNLNDGRCTAGYRSTALSCWPNVQRGMWEFEPNRYGKSFTRQNAHLLKLGNQVEPLVDAIANYFGRYRSLNA